MEQGVIFSGVFGLSRRLSGRGTRSEFSETGQPAASWNGTQRAGVVMRQSRPKKTGANVWIVRGPAPVDAFKRQKKRVDSTDAPQATTSQHHPPALSRGCHVFAATSSPFPSMPDELDFWPKHQSHPFSATTPPPLRFCSLRSTGTYL